MAWYDDIQGTIANASDTALKTAGQYLDNAANAAPTLIQVAEAQGGNLTAAQIEAGATGNPVPPAKPQATPAQLQNSLSFSQFKLAAGGGGLVLLGAAALVFLFLKRSGRK